MSSASFAGTAAGSGRKERLTAAPAYVIKPADFGEFMNAVEKLGVFWVT